MYSLLKRVSTASKQDNNKNGIYGILMPSILCMLVCSVCLMGTTWAWFQASQSSGVQTLSSAHFGLTTKVEKVIKTAAGTDIETVADTEQPAQPSQPDAAQAENGTVPGADVATPALIDETTDTSDKTSDTPSDNANGVQPLNATDPATTETKLELVNADDGVYTLEKENLYKVTLTPSGNAHGYAVVKVGETKYLCVYDGKDNTDIEFPLKTEAEGTTLSVEYSWGSYNGEDKEDLKDIEELTDKDISTLDIPQTAEPSPSADPTEIPTPSASPSVAPSEQPTVSASPSAQPSESPAASAEPSPSASASASPSAEPSESPAVSAEPTVSSDPVTEPTVQSTSEPTAQSEPEVVPTTEPSSEPEL